MCKVCQERLSNEPVRIRDSRTTFFNQLMWYGDQYGKLALIHLVSNEFCIAAQYSELQLSTVEILDIAYHTAAHAWDLGETSLPVN